MYRLTYDAANTLAYRSLYVLTVCKRTHFGRVGFRQRVRHARRPVGSFSAAPAVAGVWCPGGTWRTFGVLAARGSPRAVAGRGGCGPVGCGGRRTPGMFSGAP
jgi:hypothetical protein